MADAHSIDLKKCSRCRVMKPRTEFYRTVRNKDGLHPQCKSCGKIYSSSPLQLAAGRAYYRRNSEKVKARVIARDRKIKRRRSGRLKPTSELTPEQLTRRRKMARALRTKHLWRFRCNEQANRSRRKNAFRERVDPLIVFERDNWTCGICRGLVNREDASLDHVLPLSRGGLHEYSNVQLAHLSCNVKKGASLDFVR